LLKALLACGLAACGTTPHKQTFPKPTTTTAFVATSDYRASAQLFAVDLETRAKTSVLGPDVMPLDPMIRVFEKNLYLVGREYQGKNNNVVVLDPNNNYQPKCGGKLSACQFALPFAFNARDFLAVSETKAYLTSSESNSVTTLNPLTGQITGTIDIAAERAKVGDRLDALDPDGIYDLNRMAVTGNYLLVQLQFIDNSTYAPTKTNDACGFVAGRVAVIDMTTDAVVKMIRLQGSNPDGPFVTEPGTTNLLVNTTGPQGQFAIGPCNGIERIDTESLDAGGSYLSQQQMGGVVFSFAVDDQGRGIAFVGTDGDFNHPEYKVFRFDSKTGVVGDPLIAPGPKGFTFFGFTAMNDRDQAWVALPYSKQSPTLAAFALANGQLLDGKTIDLPQGAVDIGFYPGQNFARP
jgi:hypothetical protein